jgi:hypothetical protein
MPSYPKSYPKKVSEQNSALDLSNTLEELREDISLITKKHFSASRALLAEMKNIIKQTQLPTEQICLLTLITLRNSYKKEELAIQKIHTHPAISMFAPHKAHDIYLREAMHLYFLDVLKVLAKTLNTLPSLAAIDNKLDTLREDLQQAYSKDKTDTNRYAN